jgi:hypothetical protein
LAMKIAEFEDDVGMASPEWYKEDIEKGIF